MSRDCERIELFCCEDDRRDDIECDDRERSSRRRSRRHGNVVIRAKNVEVITCPSGRNRERC
ncbi:hypothetical protein HAHI6034_03200 [Hathewaya histolytica]|uniref:Uncharacterized protein n=1 Tax=Hathewaya histolytica TaxID=1498 RepID=A0A4U9R4B5_HATHI|nr:hypothetical protein [Hathewaya histolytica]VTQ85281.1 Uncharacterised protein [Hathewaya histolytica]